MPGVAGVFTAADLDLDRLPASGVVEGSTDALEGPFGREALARELVRFVGEAIAIVVAGTLAQAEDAAEAVVGDYDPLPAVTDPETALDATAPRLWPEPRLERGRLVRGGTGTTTSSPGPTSWRAGGS